MRMPELKSLSRDRGLRNYSRISKAELVAFLTIWLELLSVVRGQRASDKTCAISQFVVGNKILPMATFYLF